MTAIQLDYSSDDSNVHISMGEEVARPLIEAEVHAWLREFGFADVTFEIVRVFGPAGGAAVIDFTAPTVERLRAFVEMYDGGNGEVDFLMEDVW